MRENQFQSKVIKLLENVGCWIHNVHGERMQRRGVPDLLVIHPRWRGFIELKVGTNRCSDVQKKVFEEIEKRDFLVYVLRYDSEHDAIQIETRDGDALCLVAWGALWNWLKNPVVPTNDHSES